MKTVYWAPYFDLDEVNNLTTNAITIMNEPPIRVITQLKHRYPEIQKRNSPTANFFKCPAVFHNMFELLTPFDYSFMWDGNQVRSMHGDQQLFDRVVQVRETKGCGMFTFKLRYVFFTEDDLEITTLPPFTSANELNEKAITLAGTFNISKWLRPLEVVYIFKKKNDQINIKQYEPVMNIQFHTRDAIKLKQFNITQEVRDVMHACVGYKNICPMTSMKHLYDMFTRRNLNKRIINIIKQNLVD